MLLSNFLAISTSNASSSDKVFKGCTQLRKVYPTGVAISAAKAKKQAVKPKVKASLYRANRKLDADRDGTICEVKKPKVSPLPVTTVPLDSTSVVVTSTATAFPSEFLPISGTVTGANLGYSRVPPARNFDGKVMCAVQNTKSVNFDYRNGPVTPCSQADYVILKYSGLIPRTNRGIQSVKIEARHDDAVYMSIDGVPVLDKWMNCVCNSSYVIPNLDLNIDHSIEIWYYENSGEAFLSLKWQSATTIPSTTSPSTTSTRSPVTSISSGLVTTTTTCAPNQVAISALTQKASYWRGQNRNSTFSLLQYEGSPVAGIWLTIHEVNYSNYVRALAALNTCKQIGYLFDDWDLILYKARTTRNLKATDSVAFLMVV
jgi:hypothetical protein